MTAEKLRQIKQQHQLTQEQIESVSAQIDEVRNEMTVKAQQVDEVTAEIKRIQDEVYAEFVERSGINLNEYEGTHLNKRAALAKQRKDLEKQRMNLQAALDYENKRDFAKALTAVQQQIASMRDKLEKLDEQERTQHTEEEVLNKEVRELEGKLDKLKVTPIVFGSGCVILSLILSTPPGHACVTFPQDKTLAKANELKAIQASKASLNSEKSALARKLAAHDATIERCCSDLHELLQKAQLDQISLPTLDRRDSRASSDSESQGSSFPSSQLSAVMQRDYTIANNLDFSSIEHLKELKGKKAEETRRQYEKDVTTLQVWRFSIILGEC